MKNKQQKEKNIFFWVNKNGIYYSASYVSQFIYLFIYLEIINRKKYVYT